MLRRTLTLQSYVHILLFVCLVPIAHAQLLSPVCSDFESKSAEDWTEIGVWFTYPPGGPEGPNDYYLHCQDEAGASLVYAPQAYHGDWASYCAEGCGVFFSWDFIMINDGDFNDVFEYRPNVIISGNGLEARYNASFKVAESGSLSGWHHIDAYVMTGAAPPPGWVMRVGTDADWNTLLANVSRVQFGYDHTSFQEERFGLDNVCLRDSICGGICGTKYNDLNNNGILDEGEPVVPGWQFTLDGEGKSLTAETNEDGRFCFFPVSSGTYQLKEVVRAGWISTTPPSAQYNVNLGIDDYQEFIFLNHQPNPPCDYLLPGWLDSTSCTYHVGIAHPSGSPITHIKYSITGGTVDTIYTAPCIAGPMVPGSTNGTLIFTPSCTEDLDLAIMTSARDADPDTEVTLIVYHADGQACTLTFTYRCVNESVGKCNLYGPDTLMFENGIISPNPFTLSYEFTNIGSVTMLVENIEIELPPSLTTTDPLSRYIRKWLKPGKWLYAEWIVTAQPSAVDQTFRITVRTNIYRNDTTSFSDTASICELVLFIPGTEDLQCEAVVLDWLNVDENLGTYTPNPFPATIVVSNLSPQDARDIEVEIDLSSAPNLALLPGSQPTWTIPIISGNSSENYSWQIQASPVAMEAMETIVFRYRSKENPEWQECRAVVLLEGIPKKTEARCTLTAPDALTVDDASYDSNPFDLDYTLTNTGNAQLDATEITIQLPAYITTTDPLTQSVSPLAPSAQHDITWPLTALTSAYDRDALITVTAKDGEGNTLSVCEHTIFIPGVDALSCEAEVPLPPVFDVDLNGYKPNPFDAMLTVYNQLDSALTNVEVEVQMSSSDVTLDGTANPQVYPSLAAGSSKTNNWRFRINTLLDKQTTVTVTYRTRSDQYPEWHECSVDVTIPPRRYTYCADCTADGIDTVWSNNTNEVMLPVPFQIYTAVANNCTGDLSDVQCTITLPNELSLDPGVNQVQTIKHIAPGDTMYAFWEVLASPNENDYTSQVQIDVTSSKIATPSVCNHTVRIVHTEDIQLNPAKKLVYFMAVQDGNLPAPQSVMVYAGFPTEMPWTAQYPSWLDVSPANSNTNESAAIQPNTTNLPFGRYWGTIDFASAQPNAPKFIDVVYDIVDVTGVGSIASAANGLQLHANYPNPFSHSTTIKYTTQSAQPVTITVYNTLGVPIRVVQRDAQPGENTVQISGLNLGIYMLVLQGKDGVATRMMIAN